MSKKIFLLVVCVLLTGFMVITSQRMAVRADDIFPTTAPAEETIISQADVYATLTAVPTLAITPMPYPIPSEIANYDDFPYPAPQVQSVSLKDVLASIFGNLSLKGKQSLQKK